MDQTLPRTAASGKPTERDEEILRHVSRYRLTTRKVLHRVFFPDSQMNAVTKVTQKLVERGFLRKHPLPGEPKTHPLYFMAGPAAGGRYGIPRKAVERGALGPQSLPTRLGILLFCCGGPRRRECLTVSEVAQKRKGLDAKGVHAAQYYWEDFDGAQPLSLGQIRVDLDTDPSTLMRNCERDLAARREHAVYRHLIDNGRFLFSIVTATEPKAEAIRDAVRRRDFGPVIIQVECHPDLADFLPPGPLG